MEDYTRLISISGFGSCICALGGSEIFLDTCGYLILAKLFLINRNQLSRSIN